MRPTGNLFGKIGGWISQFQALWVTGAHELGKMSWISHDESRLRERGFNTEEARKLNFWEKQRRLMCIFFTCCLVLSTQLFNNTSAQYESICKITYCLQSTIEFIFFFFRRNESMDWGHLRNGHRIKSEWDNNIFITLIWYSVNRLCFQDIGYTDLVRRKPWSGLFSLYAPNPVFAS